MTALCSVLQGNSSDGEAPARLAPQRPGLQPQGLPEALSPPRPPWPCFSSNYGSFLAVPPRPLPPAESRFSLENFSSNPVLPEKLPQNDASFTLPSQTSASL